MNGSNSSEIEDDVSVIDVNALVKAMSDMPDETLKQVAVCLNIQKSQSKMQQIDDPSKQMSTNSISSFQQLYKGALKQTIIDDVPSYMKNFPKRSIYLVVLARGMQVLIFMVVVVAFLYISNVGSKYLSIGGANIGSECQEVSKTISISLKLDDQGFWEG